MKVVIYADEFKALASKMKPAVGKGAAFHSLETVKFVAKNGNISATATDYENFLSVALDGRIIEDGTCYIDFDTLKKMVVKGDDIVISTGDNNITVNAGKKSYEILNFDYSDSFPETPKLKVANREATTISAPVLANMKTLSVMASSEEAYGLMHAIRFDLEKRPSRLIAIDGHRIGIWNLDGVDAMKSFTIGLKCVEILKNAIGKDSGLIRVACDGKYAAFTGEDFTYIVKCIEGIYYNVDDIINKLLKDYDYKIRVDNKELAEIAKEYKKGVSTRDNMSPMMFAFSGSNGAVATAFDFKTYMTSDKLESVEWKMTKANPEHFCKAINPSFIVDACAFCEENITIISTFSEKTPMYMGSGDKEVLVLPVNICGENNLLAFALRQAG